MSVLLVALTVSSIALASAVAFTATGQRAAACGSLGVALLVLVAATVVAWLAASDTRTQPGAVALVAAVGLTGAFNLAAMRRAPWRVPALAIGFALCAAAITFGVYLATAFRIF